MVSFHISPASVNANVEQVEVASQILVNSFLQLRDIFDSSEFIDGWEANVL